MEEGLITFQKFRDPDIAHDIAEKLKKAGMYFIVENDDKFFDATFANNPMNKETRIKLLSKDFNRANEILDAYYKDQLQHVPEDYYLFEFTNKELFEILSKPDEWGNFDYTLAQEILKQRGENIVPEELVWLKTKRINELAKADKADLYLLIIGYISAFLGGIFGILTGAILVNSKRTLPNGFVTYMYAERDRRHGKIMTAIGIVVLIASLISLYKSGVFR